MRDISRYHLRLRVRSPPYLTGKPLEHVFPMSFQYISVMRALCFKPRNHGRHRYNSHKKSVIFLPGWRPAVWIDVGENRMKGSLWREDTHTYRTLCYLQTAVRHWRRRHPYRRDFSQRLRALSLLCTEILSPLGDRRLRQAGWEAATVAKAPLSEEVARLNVSHQKSRDELLLFLSQNRKESDFFYIQAQSAVDTTEVAEKRQQHKVHVQGAYATWIAATNPRMDSVVNFYYSAVNFSL